MANMLTIFRIALIVPFALLILLDAAWASWTAVSIFAIAAVTDFFDGYVARKTNSVSKLGTVLDPVADKLLTCTALVFLLSKGEITGPHVPAALVIILREIWISALREALPGDQSLTVSRLAKWKTTAQFVALLMLLAPAPILSMPGLVLLWLGAALTVITGGSYSRHALRQLR